LSGWAERVIIYSVAEVLEARFSKPGGEGAPADFRGSAQIEITLKDANRLLSNYK
jgi:hypothetical protein